MKLNENGDFCLLYIEPSDEKQDLFATIGEQQKPVVLMLPQAGQPRSRLFQRPEDFIELKHIRRQSGVSVVFLTAGSELLAQMAARYGFPSYPSVDDFANFLTHGYHRRVGHEEKENTAHPPALRQVRTGPLMPSSAIAQIIALRQPLTTRPLPQRAESDPWGEPVPSGRTASEPWTGHEKGMPLSRKASEPWTGHEKGVQPEMTGAEWVGRESTGVSRAVSETGGRERSGMSEVVGDFGAGTGLPELVAEGSGSTGRGRSENARTAQRGHEINSTAPEYAEAFHDALTMPINGRAPLSWPLPGDEISSVLAAQPPESVRNTPTGPARTYGYQGASPLARVNNLVPNGSDAPAPRPLNAIPRRSSAHLADEPHSHHPGWRAEEHMFDPGASLVAPRQPVAPQRPANPAPPARVLHNSSPAPAFNASGSARPPATGPVYPPVGAPSRSSRPLAGAPGTVPMPGLPGMAPVRPAPGRPDTPGTGPMRSPVQPRPGQTPGTDRKAPKRGSIWPLLVILSLLIIAGGALGSFVTIARVGSSTPSAVTPVGSITFVSSEQLNENTSQGLNDQVRITLHGLGTPAAGKSFYAWLLGDSDQSESQSIALGKLSISNGAASLFYSGDDQHTNLLQITSRFLVTEENSSVTPLMPSPDLNSWRYYGSLPATPDPNDQHHYSFLNHLRHLLSDEPSLDELELPGGLNDWFTRNTQELIELTSGARDRWQNTHNLLSVRSQGIQLLAYLDGMSFVVQDLPAASADIQINMDTHLAGLGLLDVRGSTQNPPGYLDQIVYHLNGLLNAPGSPSNTRSLVGQILPALSNVTTWLQQLRSDDKKLLAMSDTQLASSAALSLLDDMVLQASNAYSGSTDATTGQAKPGVSWVHQQLQSLATINVSTYVTGQNPAPEVAPSSKAGPAYLQPLLRFWKEVEQIL